MIENNATIESVCQEDCPERTCCSTRLLVPVPLSHEDISRIARKTGRIDFHEKTPWGRILKVGSDGYCLFFNTRLKQCEIYDVRPFDCAMHPFDIYTGAENRWLLWDCPHSRRLSDTEIEQRLTRLEECCTPQILSIWGYEDNGIDLTQPMGFRILRPMRIRMPENIPGATMSLNRNLVEKRHCRVKPNLYQPTSGRLFKP